MNHSIVLIDKKEYDNFKNMIPEEALRRASVLIAALDENDTAISALVCEKTSDNMLDIIFLATAREYAKDGIEAAMIGKCIAMAACYSYDGVECSFYHGRVPQTMLSSMGFEQEDDCNDVYEFRIKDIKDVFASLPEKKHAFEPVFLKRASSAAWNGFRAALRKAQEEAKKNAGAGEEAPEGVKVYPEIGAMELYNKELSAFYMDEENDICACLLVSDYDEGFIIRYALSMNRASLMAMIDIFRSVFGKAVKQYDGETQVYANVVNPETLKLLSHFTQGKQKKITGMNRYVRYV